MVIRLPVIRFAITIHEFFHAWTARALGDPTAESQGRVTLNPIAHLDPIGTLAIIFGPFGWGRPVPVNWTNFRHPLRDNALVSLAGPGSNLACAFVFGLLHRLVMTGLLGSDRFMQGAAVFLQLAVYINVGLALFNLIPLAPLDGSHIMEAILPAERREGYRNFSAISPYVLMGLLVMEYMTPGRFVLGWILFPPLGFLSGLFLGY